MKSKELFSNTGLVLRCDTGSICLTSCLGHTMFLRGFFNNWLQRDISVFERQDFFYSESASN